MAKISKEGGVSDVFADDAATQVDAIHGTEQDARVEDERRDEDAEAEVEVEGVEIDPRDAEAREWNASNVSDALVWVDGDPDRAALMLAIENERPSPRQGVTGPLTSIVDKASTDQQ